MGYTNKEAVASLQGIMKDGYLGLLTAAADNGTFTEISVAGYQRYQIKNVTTSESERSCANADLILMFEARGVATATKFGLFNGSGVLRFWGNITGGGLSMSDGTVPVIRPGELKLTVEAS